MPENPTDTARPADPSDPPALAASVVGAVRTENARLAKIRQRAEAATTSPERSHIWQDARDVPALLALVDELTAQCDLARDAAVALEQELAQRGKPAATVRCMTCGGDLTAMDGVSYCEGCGSTYAASAAVLGLGLQPETSQQ